MDDQGHPGWGVQVVPGWHFRVGCGCGRGKSSPWLRLLSPFPDTPCVPIWALGTWSFQRHRKRWVSFIADAVAAVIQIVIEVSRQEG